MFFSSLILILIICFGYLNGSGLQNRELIVGTKSAEPFVMKNQDGTWGGISFDLWNRVAESLGVNYRVVEYDLEGLIKAIEDHEVDVTVSPLTITAEREAQFDFTHPYYVTGLSIAVHVKDSNNIIAILKNLISIEFLQVALILMLILFLIGLITWLFERKKNEAQFGDGSSKGLWSSFWWAAVTMTTVGYGDKAPVTTGGRIVALIWMFAALIIVSSFTAAIASALTVNQLDSKIKTQNDLYNVRVGTVLNSSSQSFLEEKKIAFRTFETAEDAVDALSKNSLDAVVYDTPILRYLINSKGHTGLLKVLPRNLELQYYGFGLPPGSLLRKEINKNILTIISQKSWQDILYKYMGE